LITDFLYVDISQNQGDVQLNKKEGDEKKKEKSPLTWHRIECDGSVKKGFEGVGVQPFQTEEERVDMLFWSSTKSRCHRDCRG